MFAIKKTYGKPRLQVFQNPEEITNQQVQEMSREELEQYLSAQKKLEEARVYRGNADFILREIGDEILIVPTGSASQNYNGIIELNETGGFLWKFFQEPHTVAEAVLEAQKYYHDTTGQMEIQIREFVKEYAAKGILQEEKR